ncbi:MAG: hypothetical protein V7754_22625 [Halioglobus sp.]
MPPQAIEAYEALRAQVLGTGHGRTGLAALLYHGMTRGLAVMMATPEIAECEPENPEGRLPVVANDPALVRLLANMVLQFQSEVQHVY